MPTSASTRLGLIGPSATDLISQGDDIIRAIITGLETYAAGVLQGPIVSRAAAGAGNAQFLYYATDTGVLSYSTGSAWVDINLAPPTWTALTLQNNWQQPGGSNQGPQYTKDAFGFVHLRGAMYTQGTSNNCFTLPTGFRPPKTEYFPILVDKAATAGTQLGWMQIAGASTGFPGLCAATTSVSNPISNPTVVLSNNDYVYLGGVTFSVN
jgi:hypothetical protein